MFMYLTRGMDSIDFTNSTEGILHQLNVGCGFHWVFVTDLQVINMPEHKQLKGQVVMNLQGYIVAYPVTQHNRPCQIIA